ncbi:hypothetical protein L7F22_000716 [Adiantum nelumboides]|nr:hypothetical protein [Adiantum nelumboides]
MAGTKKTARKVKVPFQGAPSESKVDEQSKSKAKLATSRSLILLPARALCSSLKLPPAGDDLPPPCLLAGRLLLRSPPPPPPPPSPPPAQKQILSDFASSFSPSVSAPSVSSWWSIAASYTDSSHSHISSTITLAAQTSVTPYLPLPLTRGGIASLLLDAFKAGELPVDERGIYFVLTGANIAVEGMCVSACGFHDHLQGNTMTRHPVQEKAHDTDDLHVQVKIGSANKKTTSTNVVFAWVGNSQHQCPGQCAWPFALPEYWPQGAVPLVPPNGDVSMDGMVINFATLLVGAATNPHGLGYFQGPPTEPLEAASACTGIFGAYPGFPGALLTNSHTGASFNVHGNNGRTFLLPSIWNPTSQTCTPPF